MPDTDRSTLIARPRRLRKLPRLRESLRRVRLHPSQFIIPVFICEGTGVRREVKSMPGVFQMSIDVALPWLQGCADRGVGGYIAFGVIDRAAKDATGSAALDPDNVVCKLVRATRDVKLPMVAITDLCLCEYTDHGHCGPIDGSGAVGNDATLPLLVTQAVNHARAGADIIAPSGMMDGTIAALRTGLDDARFSDVALMSYSVKYASAFYGPFRDAADSAPAFGDRRGYQMDPARGIDEALLEAQLDVDQGADIVMVKPAGAYLDVICAVRAQSRVPVAAYQVSGEYAMLQAAIANGWLDARAITESLLAIARAGADLIISYYADRLHELPGVTGA
ncbi:MAG TPA: porphobilinogen synthase [Tepidisphaeraceae bacterium]|nr:porphobilinogen synthase [Tepidisphaeraceae bacterium]